MLLIQVQGLTSYNPAYFFIKPGEFLKIATKFLNYEKTLNSEIKFLYIIIKIWRLKITILSAKKIQVCHSLYFDWLGINIYVVFVLMSWNLVVEAWKCSKIQWNG